MPDLADLAAQILEVGTVRPGDSLILRVREPDGPEDLRAMSEDLRRWLPDNVRIVLVTEAIEVTVLRTGEDAPQPTAGALPQSPPPGDTDG